MITELATQIITTLVLQVNGNTTVPFNQNCICIPEHRSVECSIDTLISSGEVYSVITTRLNGEPTNDEVMLECRQ